MKSQHMGRIPPEDLPLCVALGFEDSDFDNLSTALEDDLRRLLDEGAELDELAAWIEPTGARVVKLDVLVRHFRTNDLAVLARQLEAVYPRPGSLRAFFDCEEASVSTIRPSPLRFPEVLGDHVDDAPAARNIALIVGRAYGRGDA